MANEPGRRKVWVSAIALPSGPDQHCVNILVMDDYSKRMFVMEPEDVLEDDVVKAVKAVKGELEKAG